MELDSAELSLDSIELSSLLSMELSLDSIELSSLLSAEFSLDSIEESALSTELSSLLSTRLSLDSTELSCEEASVEEEIPSKEEDVSAETLLSVTEELSTKEEDCTSEELSSELSSKEETLSVAVEEKLLSLAEERQEDELFVPILHPPITAVQPRRRAKSPNLTFFILSYETKLVFSGVFSVLGVLGPKPSVSPPSPPKKPLVVTTSCSFKVRTYMSS